MRRCCLPPPTIDLGVFDALTGKLRHVEKQMGQTPWLMLNP